MLMLEKFGNVRTLFQKVLQINILDEDEIYYLEDV